MIYIHTGKVTDSKYCTFGSACFYLSDIPIRDIPYSFLLLRTLILPLSCNVVSHPDPAGWCNRLCSGTVDHSAFRPAIFCFLLEIPIHFIFHLYPKYTKSQSSKTPAPVSRSGDSALCERGSPSLNLLRCPPRMAGPCSCGRTASSAPAASPTQAFCYRLPGV